MQRLGPLVRVQAVRPLEPLRVHVTFADGTSREIDLDPYLRGPIFETIRSNFDVFRSVRVVGNTIGWDSGADIDPDVLYYELTPAGSEEGERHQ